MSPHKDCRSCRHIGDVDPVSKVHECRSPKMQRLAEVRELDPEYRDNHYCRFYEVKG